jgi:hypothetical protein
MHRTYFKTGEGEKVKREKGKRGRQKGQLEVHCALSLHVCHFPFPLLTCINKAADRLLHKALDRAEELALQAAGLGAQSLAAGNHPAAVGIAGDKALPYASRKPRCLLFLLASQTP